MSIRELIKTAPITRSAELRLVGITVKVTHVMPERWIDLPEAEEEMALMLRESLDDKIYGDLRRKLDNILLNSHRQDISDKARAALQALFEP